jgi:hypothetical protein
LLEIPVTNVSRSITSIKRKARDIEEDIAFLREIGYLSFDKGEMKFVSADRTKRLSAGADDLPSTRFARISVIGNGESGLLPSVRGLGWDRQVDCC